MARTHTLKIEHEYMDAVKSGEKTFVVRRDDRVFQKGDILELCRYGQCRSDGHSFGYMGDDGAVVSSYPENEDVDRFCVTITYVLTGGQLGIEPGFVVMGVTPNDPR